MRDKIILDSSESKMEIIIGKYMNKSFIVITIYLLLCAAAVAQPDTMWVSTYGGIAFEAGYCVRQNADGGYSISGHTSTISAGETDIYLITTNALGETQWSHTYGGPGVEYCFGLLKTLDGGYAIPGRTFLPGAIYSDIILVKTDSSGIMQWSRSYGGGLMEVGEDVQQTADGGLVVLGYTMSYGAGMWDIWLFKTDLSGSIIWSHTYGGALNDECIRVQHTTDGGFVIIGNTMSFGAGNNDVYLIKTDSLGNELWSQTYGTVADEWGHGIQQTEDNGYIITGTRSFSPGIEDILLIKTDSLGTEQWTRTYGGDGDDYAADVQLTVDGGYIIAGRTNSYGAGDKDMYLIRTDAIGDTVWTQTFGGPGFDYANYIQVTEDGGYAAIGSTTSFGAGSQDAYLVRLAPEDFTPDVSIILEPIGAPIQIPAGGGSFQFNVDIINNDMANYLIDFWTAITTPSGIEYPILIRNNLSLPGLGTISRDHLNQSVPSTAVPGDYNYTAYARDHSTWETLAEDSFPFTKLAGDNSDFQYYSWEITGWGDDETFKMASPVLPNDYIMLDNYPNPFNASTIICFDLPTASNVSLNVYDIQGRQAGVLHAMPLQSWYPAGQHSVVWDAGDCASGVYFVRLSADGGQQSVRKMVLLK